MNARELTAILGGRWCGSYGLARCPAHDDENPSLSIGDGEKAVLLKCFAGCEFQSIRSAIDARRAGAVSPAVSERSNDTAMTARASDEERMAAARDILGRSHRDDEALSVYLRARGITLQPPPSLRFQSALLHTPTNLYLPAMVAAVQRSTDEVVAIHRTFLTADLTRKAGVQSPKMALGPLGDGAVHLGSSGDALGLAEGIETALSAMQLSGVPCWAVLGSRFHSVALPHEVREVHVFADNGAPGRVAAEKAAHRFTKEGRRVLLRFPPATAGDWNDVIIRSVAA